MRTRIRICRSRVAGRRSSPWGAVIALMVTTADPVAAHAHVFGPNVSLVSLSVGAAGSYERGGFT